MLAVFAVRRFLPTGAAPGPEKTTEVDPRTGLIVPKFYDGPVRSDDSIFLMIASYRDFQCSETVASALSRADHPERVFVAVVQQNSEGDEPCEAPNVFAMDAADATGPVYARHIGSRMYRGEAFAMQVDAHVQFARGWDSSLVDEWLSAGNEMAVLSTYLTDVQHSIDANGHSLRKTRPIMCNSDYEGRPPARYLRHGAQPEEEPVVEGEPMMQPFWAAGFSFGRGHFLQRVPYDCCLPMVFMGEEISIGIRGWTHGYDFYTPEKSVVFHEYAQKSARRHKVHLFFEQQQQQHDTAAESLKRLTALIGMAPDVRDYDATDAQKYGLGTKRRVEDFYRLFLVNTLDRKAQPLCKFVKTGVMHRAFSRWRLPDGSVDYSRLADFDTAAAIKTELDTNWRPRALNALQKALDHNERAWLENALDIAKRAELPEDTDLLQMAKTALHNILKTRNN
ncbi:hypothetical protein CTAYLR_010138 [Chrysophaeum taylorii]|uniref:Glycosyltransferase n=1 Tax=Chrysophaeum taylorii TaxID=2483200 RepID=A0AAD7XHF5_9STRA|nr:hypothetical protein CTAYLR_010138 [Chrysophaeum taylorii]